LKPTIIFDFDYTLADSSGAVVACINFALEEMGGSGCPADDCKATIGLSLPDTYHALTGRQASGEIREFQRLFIQRADEIMAPATNIYAGVPELIRALYSDGYTLAIISTKFRYRICQILDRYSLTEYFTAIIGGEDVERHKPDPESLLLCLKRLGRAPEEALLIGDSLVDAETAKRGTVRFVAVLTGRTAADQFAAYQPAAVLNKVTEIGKYLSDI
jgi:phosphoglycolate phosphatase